METYDHRARARAALSGNWGVAMLVSLVAGIIGGTSSSGIDLNLDLSDTASITAELPGGFNVALGAIAGVFGVVVILLGLALLVVHLALGGVIQLGEAKYNLNLIDRKEAEFRDLFSQFSRFKEALVMNLLQNLYILLWSLLLIIPGIIASYSYAMAPYILLEDPYCSGREALQRSKAMMDGHKGELFCLDLSFFGWMLLSILTMGIGDLWLNPYMKASRASFYRNLVNPVSYCTVE